MLRIGSGTYGQIPRPVDLMGIDQTLPGSHTALALIPLQLSIAIYSLEVKLSNPLWVNPAFWCVPIDLRYCCLSISPEQMFSSDGFPDRLILRPRSRHLIRFHWIQTGALGLVLVLCFGRFLTFPQGKETIWTPDVETQSRFVVSMFSCLALLSMIPAPLHQFEVCVEQVDCRPGLKATHTTILMRKLSQFQFLWEDTEHCLKKRVFFSAYLWPSTYCNGHHALPEAEMP